MKRYTQDHSPSRKQSKLDKQKTKMISFGCDETNAKFAQGGLRGLLTGNAMGFCLLVSFSSP